MKLVSLGEADELLSGYKKARQQDRKGAVNPNAEQSAKQVVESLLPETQERLSILNALVENICAADNDNHSGWNITLKEQFVNLNVGGAQLFSIFPDGVRLLVDAHVVDDDLITQLGPRAIDGLSKAVKPSFFVSIHKREFAELYPALRDACKSACTKATRPGQSPWRIRHAAGVVAYLHTATGHDVPAPQYEFSNDDSWLGLEQLKTWFKKQHPDFVRFGAKDDSLWREEIKYKRHAVAEAHDLLQPYVDGSSVLATDEAAQALLNRLLKLTNLLNWRDAQEIERSVLAAEGDCRDFVSLILSCLRHSRDDGWQAPLAEALDFLSARKCPSGVSKALPTYVLFLWDPETHFHIKPRLMDTVLKTLRERPLGSGQALTVNRYEHVLGVMSRVKTALADWHPADNIDLHSFNWSAIRGSAEVKSTSDNVRAAGSDDNQAPNRSARPPFDLNTILAGPPGTGKTYRLRQEYAPFFTSANERRYEFVTFHQSFSYEDFIEGIKPCLATDAGADAGAGQVAYRVEDGIFKRLVTRAIKDPDNSYAIFIDEINRANIANVLGELITLLEPDKRMQFDRAKGVWADGVQVRLPYTHAANDDAPLFGIPDNLYVVGTMNTADRSIAMIDLALRRRFRFEDVPPDATVLASIGTIETDDDGPDIRLDRLLDTMNRRIEFLFDRDHRIGHSYLMGVRSISDLEAAFRHRIIPLLEEYFYGDWEKIQLVFGDLIDERDSDSRPRAHAQCIVSHVIERPNDVLNIRDDSYETLRSYDISDELSPQSFRKIYE